LNARSNLLFNLTRTLIAAVIISLLEKLDNLIEIRLFIPPSNLQFALSRLK